MEGKEFSIDMIYLIEAQPSLKEKHRKLRETEGEEQKIHPNR